MSRAGYVKETEGKSFDIIHMMKCLGISYIVSVVLLFVFSICATIWDFSEVAVDIGIAVITGISVLACGFLSARGVSRGGLINGIIAGVLYTLLLYCIGSIVIGCFDFNIATITAFIVGIVCGGIGGVFGVNTKKRRR